MSHHTEVEATDSSLAMTATSGGFLAGWRKLPDELKLEILRYVVPRGLHIASGVFTGSTFWKGKPRKYLDFKVDILPLLACPEISQIALELLYRHNTLEIIPHDGLPIKLPPKPLRKFVHVWRAIHELEDIYSHHQSTKLAEGRVGFPVADKMSVKVLGCLEFHRPLADQMEELDIIRERVKAMDTLRFNTKELRVHFEPITLPYVIDLTDISIMLREKLTIVGQGTDVKDSECSIVTVKDHGKGRTTWVVR